MGLPPTADKVQKQRLERKAKTTKARKVRKIRRMSRSGKLHQSMNYFLQKFASKFIKLPLKVVLSLRFNGVPRNTCLNTRGGKNITNTRSVCKNSYKSDLETVSQCTFWTRRFAAKDPGHVVDSMTLSLIGKGISLWSIPIVPMLREWQVELVLLRFTSLVNIGIPHIVQGSYLETRNTVGQPSMDPGDFVVLLVLSERVDQKMMKEVASNSIHFFIPSFGQDVGRLLLL